MRKLIMQNGTELILLEHCSEVSFSGVDFAAKNTDDKSIDIILDCEGNILTKKEPDNSEYHHHVFFCEGKITNEEWQKLQILSTEEN